MADSNKLRPIDQKAPSVRDGMFDLYFGQFIRAVYQLWFVVNGYIKQGYSPPELADADALENTIYYSTTASKLVYKDSAGVVHNLY